MKNMIIPIIESLALFCCLVFGALWINDPSGPYEPPFAVSGLFFVATEFYRRYRGKLFKKNEVAKHSILDIDSKNTLFSRYINSGNSKSGNICIAFYGMTIVNASNNPFTVKDVILRYKFKGNDYNSISHVVLTGTIYAPLDKKKINALIIHSNGNNIVLMRWDNIRTEIGKRNIIPAGGVLSGSAIFVLETNKIEELAEITNSELVVIDYSGNESIHPIEFLNEWIAHGKNSVIEPKEFTSDKDGNIKYA